MLGFASSPEAPLLGELSAQQTERLYEAKPHIEADDLEYETVNSIIQGEAVLPSNLSVNASRCHLS